MTAKSVQSLSPFASIDASSVLTASVNGSEGESGVARASELTGDTGSQPTVFNSDGLVSAIDMIAEERESDRDQADLLQALDAAMADLI